MSTKKAALIVLAAFLFILVTACGTKQAGNPAQVNANVSEKPSAGASAAAKQDTDYPSKGGITFTVAYALGGGVDTATRQIAPEVEKALGQKIKVENKAGASGVVATNEFTKGKADGYTVLMHGMPSINLSTALFADQATYKMDDLIPIASWINADGNALVVPKDSKLNSLDDFMKAAKAKKLSIAVGGGVGSTDHATLVTLKKVGGIDLNMVPFNSAGDAATAVIGKHVDAGFVSLSSSTVSKDNFKFLAVTTEKRVAAYQDMPTFAELGFPEMTLGFRVGAFALKSTPPDVLKKLEAAFQKAFNSDSYKNWAKSADKPIGEFAGLDAFGKISTSASKTMKDILPMMQEDMKKAK